MRDMIMGERIVCGKSKFGRLTHESVSMITVGKYNRVSTPRVLMLDNSLCDVDSGFHTCWNKDVDDHDADHADVVNIDSQTDNQVDTPETDNDNCEVCLIAPRNPRIALVPCRHQRFCPTCADRMRDD